MITPELRSAEELAEIVDRVESRVLETWLDGRTVEQRTELVASRPSIPRDVDRALLLDLSDALSIYDLSDAIRYQLRARFWIKVDQSDHA